MASFSAVELQQDFGESTLLGVYRRSQVTIARGKGSYLFGTDGCRYLDFGSGIAVNSLGHSHPALLERLAAQGDLIWHCSNKFHVPAQIAAANKLVSSSFADRVFFCNSGAEANEGGLKMMRRKQHFDGHPERFRTIVFEGAFHGRTFGALSATDRHEYKRGFGPLLSGFDRVPLGDIDAVAAAIGDETAGVLIEVIQGDGGIRAAGDQFLRDLRGLTTERGLVLMIDEIQTGIGRTGTFLACEQSGIAPDIVSVAKGLGGGFPIGAVLVTADVAAGMDAGSHGTTFGGNPLACAIADVVVDEVTRHGFLDAVVDRGAQLTAGLNQLVEAYPAVLKERRGVGLMQGVQTVGLNARLEKACLEAGLIVLTAGDNVVRLLPPLTVSESEVNEALEIMRRVCAAMA